MDALRGLHITGHLVAEVYLDRIEGDEILNKWQTAGCSELWRSTDFAQAGSCPTRIISIKKILLLFFYHKP